MKILLVHEHYRLPGGEDSVFAAEVSLLASHGHTVVPYESYNTEINIESAATKLLTGIEAIWSQKSFRRITELLTQEKPDLVHFHNIFPLISPSAYYACSDLSVPVVQTLHNYRLLCPGANFLREGKVCEDCLGRAVAWSGIRHGCYRNSYAATAAAAAVLAAHRAIHTWQKKINGFIALSDFARRRFEAGGLPAKRIHVKPNCVRTDPGPRKGLGEYALYAGRLSEEKGLRVLLAAWQLLENPVPLRLAGDGPLREEIASEISRRNSNITMLDNLSQAQTLEEMKSARMLILPSICYENFPVTAAEAFACGLPIVCSRLGSLAEIVADQKTGLHFTPGEPRDLACKVDWLVRNPQKNMEMGHNARAAYEENYTQQRNYQLLIEIYNKAMNQHHPMD